MKTHYIKLILNGWRKLHNPTSGGQLLFNKLLCITVLVQRMLCSKTFCGRLIRLFSSFMRYSPLPVDLLDYDYITQEEV